VQQDRDGVTLRRRSLSRSWPIKFVAGEWDNESVEYVIEQVISRTTSSSWCSDRLRVHHAAYGKAEAYRRERTPRARA
jgi:hypothetical protein